MKVINKRLANQKLAFRDKVIAFDAEGLSNELENDEAESLTTLEGYILQEDKVDDKAEPTQEGTEAPVAPKGEQDIQEDEKPKTTPRKTTRQARTKDEE